MLGQVTPQIPTNTLWRSGSSVRRMEDPEATCSTMAGTGHPLPICCSSVAASTAGQGAVVLSWLMAI